MRISAIGRTSLRRQAQRGLTLVEVLVVVLILGLMAGVVVMTLPSDEDTAKAEAFRFASQVRVAQELAITRGQIVGLRTDSGGYDFLVYSANGWQPLTLPGNEAPAHQLGLDAQMSIELGGEPATGTAGGDQPFTLSRQEREALPPEPDLLFLPTGGNPAFTAFFTGPVMNWQVVSAADGTLTVEAANG